MMPIPILAHCTQLTKPQIQQNQLPDLRRELDLVVLPPELLWEGSFLS